MKETTARKRLKKIAEVLEQHDQELLASDGPVPQEPKFLREIYLLATEKESKPCIFRFTNFGNRNCERKDGHKGKHKLHATKRTIVESDNNGHTDDNW